MALQNETPPPTPAKRKKTSEDDAEEQAGAAGTAVSGSSGTSAGMPLFSPRSGGSLKPMNKHSLHFTKKFYFKIYANDWMLKINSDGTDCIGFMTVIPWAELCMYISPDEYLDCIRQSNFAKIKKCGFQLKFKSVRTPFDANTTDAAEANGNLQFELKRFDGLEQVMPFQVEDIEPDGTRHQYKTNIELIQRLYGLQSLAGLPNNTTVNALPATMRERGLSWRPVWQFSGTPRNTAETAGTYLPLNYFTSCIPVGEYETESVNTNSAKMTEGYCFNKVCYPKNGYLTTAPSIYGGWGASNVVNPGQTRINTKLRMYDITQPNDVQVSPNSVQYRDLFGGGTTTLTGQPQLNKVALEINKVSFDHNPENTRTLDGQTWVTRSGTIGPAQMHINDIWPGTNAGAVDVPAFDSLTVNKGTLAAETTGNINAYGFGYTQAMGNYTTAKIENYNMFTSRNDPPLHHIQSMMIGALPKTNRDTSIVKGTFEFECETHCEVEIQNGHGLYYQLAFNSIANDGSVPPSLGYVDSAIEANPDYIYRSRWVNNETDVMLFDDKYWNKSYGLAGKPLFEVLPADVPTNMTKFKRK